MSIGNACRSRERWILVFVCDKGVFFIMSGIIEKLVEKGVMVVSAQDSYLFMLIVFLWLCWKVREMRVRPKYLAERGIIKLIAKDIACEKEKKQVLRNVHRYKELLSRQYKVKMRNLMQDEQFLRLAVVR